MSESTENRLMNFLTAFLLLGLLILVANTSNAQKTYTNPVVYNSVNDFVNDINNNTPVTYLKGVQIKGTDENGTITNNACAYFRGRLRAINKDLTITLDNGASLNFRRSEIKSINKDGDKTTTFKIMDNQNPSVNYGLGNSNPCGTALPVTVTSFTATEVGDNIAVDLQVQDESLIQEYEIRVFVGENNVQNDVYKEFKFDPQNLDTPTTTYYEFLFTKPECVEGYNVYFKLYKREANQVDPVKTVVISL